MIKNNCLICKTTFTVSNFEFQRGYGKFCSRKCMGKSYELGVDKDCLTCGKNFHVKNYVIKNGGGKYCSLKCRNKGYIGKIFSKNTMFKKGEPIKENNPNWKGGIKYLNGYVMLYKPDHPNCINEKYIFEHRLVMEKYLGRYLESHEIVHHKNHIKTDNRIENLQLVTVSEHSKLHYGEIEGLVKKGDKGRYLRNNL